MRDRQEIDEMLEAAGWKVQHQRAMNLGASLGVGVREVTLRPGHGRADDVLFVNRRAVGVIEAKPRGTPLVGVEWQSAKARAIRVRGNRLARDSLHQLVRP